MKRHYFGYSQIDMEFKALPDKEKITTLVTALEIKDINPEKTKEVCLANAMGYTLSISGSGFFEKL